MHVTFDSGKCTVYTTEGTLTNAFSGVAKMKPKCTSEFSYV